MQSLIQKKKGVMNEVIGVFIIILVVAVLGGMAFLFTSSLKNQVQTSTTVTGSVTNETSFLNRTLDTLSVYQAGSGYVLPSNCVITEARNATSGVVLLSGNYSISNCVVTNASTTEWNNAYISYTFNYVSGSAYTAVNSTENAGATIITYLPLLFLALIFGAILLVVLKVILPYIKVGQSMTV